MTPAEEISSFTRVVQSASTDKQACIDILANFIQLLNAAKPDITCQIALLLHLPWDLPSHNYHLHLVGVCRYADEVVVADPFPGEPGALLFGTTRSGQLIGDKIIVHAGWGTISYRILSDEAITAIRAINASNETTPAADLWNCHKMLQAVAPAHAARALMRIGDSESKQQLAQIIATTGLKAMYAERLPWAQAAIRRMHDQLQERKTQHLRKT